MRNVGSPDIHECFHGLMGSQRTSGIWGVTISYASGQPRKLGVNAWYERNENDVFLAFGLGKREGVGEDSRHGIVHVDIQVGSCICLSVCLC